MADEPVVPEGQVEGAKPDDRVQNYSMEMNRKIENAVKPLEDKINTLLSKIAPPAKAVATSEEDLDEMLYSDPKRYARTVREQATAEARNAMQSMAQSENAKNQVLGRLVADFPELRDQSTPFAKAALAEYESLPENLKQDPVAYELAVSRAALKQGTRPISQRSNDEFTLGNNSGSKPRSSAKKDDAELEAVLEVAKLFGKDVDSDEYKAAIKGHMNRDYFKYREPKPVKK
jgi:hypothetical protein